MVQKNNHSMTITEEFTQKIKAEQRSSNIMKWAPVFVLIALIAFFSITCSTSFPVLSNVIAILNQLAIPLIIAVGLTFVIIIGSMDLSIDGVVGMTGSMFSVLVLNNQNGNNLGLFGVVIVLVLGLLSGTFIGTIHVKAKVPTFMVSFGMSSIASGIAILSYHGIPATILDPTFVSLAKADVLGIPFIALIAIIVFVIALVLQNYTSFGRYVYAIGTNETVTQMSGININKIKVGVFAFCGLCLAVAGILGSMRLGHGEIMIGVGTMFPAVTAVVVGGTSLAGGKGGVVNTLVGTLIITVLNNGLILIGTNPYIQTAVQGTIILVAVALTIKHSSNQISK
jgi:Ribose/xylose/arabinose/galactoside ABC-type transport systems, permease components